MFLPKRYRFDNVEQCLFDVPTPLREAGAGCTAWIGPSPISAPTRRRGSDILDRLRSVGYEFEVTDALPSPDDLRAAFAQNAEGEKVKAAGPPTA